MNNSEYYVNNNKYNYCTTIPNRISPCLRRDSYLSEFWSEEEKKLARDNLGITEIIDELRNLILNKLMGNNISLEELTNILKEYVKQSLLKTSLDEWINGVSARIAQDVINNIKENENFITLNDSVANTNAKVGGVLLYVAYNKNDFDKLLQLDVDLFHPAPINNADEDSEIAALTSHATRELIERLLTQNGTLGEILDNISNLQSAVGVPYDNDKDISTRISELESNLLNPSNVAREGELNPNTNDLVTVGYLNNKVSDLNNKIGNLSASSNNTTLDFGQTKTIATVLGTPIKVTMPTLPTDNDTKNTTGTSNNTTNKLFVVGATTQNENGVTTNTNSNVYIENNKLYVSNNEVITSDNILGLLNMLALAEALEPYLENELQSIRWESTSGNSVEDSEPHIDVLLIGNYSKGDDSLTLRPTNMRIYTNSACTTLAQSNWYETPGTYYIKGVYTNSNLEEFVTEDYLTWTINQASVISIEVEGGRFDKDVIYTSGNDNTTTYIPGTVYGIYNNGTRSVVSATSTLTSLNTNKATTSGKDVIGRQSGEVTIKVRYLYNGTIEKIINYPIEVREKVLESIEWESSYYNGKVGTNLTLSRIKLVYDNEDIAYTYSNASEVTLYINPECTLEFDSTQPGTYHIYAKYRNLITNNNLDVTLNEESTYTINFIVDGTQYSSSSGITGTNITVPSNPNKTGYTFIGWNTNQNATTSSNVITEIGTSDVTYYAIWQIKTYTVTLEITNGTTSSINPQTVTYGNKASWTVSANSGYKLPEIAYNGIISGNLVLSNTVTSNISVQLACIQLNSYSINWNDNGATTAHSGGSDSVQDGSSITLPTTNPIRKYNINWNVNGGEGTISNSTVTYTFSNWWTDPSNGTQVTASTKPTANSEYYAHWTAPTSITLPTPTRNGYNFVGWATTNNATVANVNKNTIPTADVIYYAIWTLVPTYTIKFMDGETTMSSQTGTEGTLINVPNTTKEGYIFDGWYENSNLTGNPVTPITTIGTSDKMYYGKWTQQTTYYFSVGTTVPTTSNYTTVNDATTTIPTTKEFINNSGSKALVYVLAPSNKTVTIKDTNMNIAFSDVYEDTSITIPNHKVWTKTSKVGNGGSITVVLN